MIPLPPPPPRIIRAMLALLAMLLAAVPSWAQVPAQGVWRCGNTYQAQPCPGGQAITAQDPRSPDERALHDAQVAREAQAARTLEQQRLRAEREAPRAPVPPAAADDLPEPNGPLFKAKVPKPPKAAKAKKPKPAKAAPAHAAASAARH